MGAQVVGTDDQGAERLAANLQPLAGLPVDLHLGGMRAADLVGADLIVLSPGVPPDRGPLREARQARVLMIGELELASRFIEAPIVGITGTNGKSTVTTLCGVIAAETGRPAFCGGNLGTPLSDAVGTAAAGPAGIVVCEMSSFQLEATEHLHCRAAAVLNLTPDHLDRYPSMEAYGDAKARIFRNLGPEDVRVLNGDDQETLALFSRNFGSDMPVYLFSVKREVPLGGFVRGEDLVLRLAGRAEESYPISALQLTGRHNLQNALCAALLMRASGLASAGQVLAALQKARPLPHRMELVGEHRGVRYFDDSKGTNVDAVVAGLSGFPQPFALIAGGRHKGGSYAPLAQVLRENTVRGVVVIGEAAPLIEAALDGITKVVRASSLEEAVQRAAALCQPGDAVVLSPACSSFDMFRDYAHRAEVFCAAVRRLMQGGTP
jgi:UDP-N-acetylmuramoylalanine--D-glutamate ligase